MMLQPSYNLTRRQEVRALTFIFAAAVLLFGIGLGRTGFQGTDEERYAQVAKEIGPRPAEFFVMHLCGEYYPDKPPVFFWMIRASYALLGGVSPLAARLPLWLSALAALALAYLLMRQMEGPAIALLGLLALMLSFRFVWAGRWLRLDMPLLAFTCGAFWCTTRILFPRPGQRDAGLGWALLGWAMATAGSLTKGTALPIWMGTVGMYALWRKDWSVLRRHRPLAGLLVTAGIAALWLVPAWLLAGREYLGVTFGLHVVTRYVGEIRHAQWFGYFIPKLLSDGLPVALFLPAALWWGWRNRHDPADGGRLPFLLIWIGFVLVFFSIPTGKRGQYILPLYPAMALLCARFLAAALSTEQDRLGKTLRGHLYVLAILMVIAGLLPWPLRIFFADDFKVDPPIGFSLGALVLLSGLGYWMFRQIRQQRPHRAIGALAVGLYGIYLLIFGCYFPRQIDDTSRRAIIETIEAAGDGEGIVALYKYHDPFLVYGRIKPRPFKSTSLVPEYAARPEIHWFLTRGRMLDRLIDNLPEAEAWSVAGRWRLEAEGEVLVLLHRPSAETSPSLP